MQIGRNSQTPLSFRNGVRLKSVLQIYSPTSINKTLLAKLFRRKNMRCRFTFVLVIIALSTIAALNVVSAENWPQWRGPALNGVSDEKNLPVKWTTEENVTWKLEMPGWSGSTLIV